MAKIADAVKAAIDRYEKAKNSAANIEKMRKAIELIHRISQSVRKR